VSDTFNVKSEILSRIDKTSDSDLKSILLLMLGVLEELTLKVDNAIDNEKKMMRSFVLNGHEDNHHAHHDWIAQRIAHQGRCEWANKEVAKQNEALANKKNLATKLAEAIVQQFGIILVTALTVAAGFTWLK